MDKEQIERKARRSRRKGAELLLDVMMTRSWSACVEFAVILSKTEGMKDLGEKLVRYAGGGNVRDERDRGTLILVQENRRVIEEKNKLTRENESLMKEKRSEKREKIGERLLRVGLEMEKESAFTQYKWKQYIGIPGGDNLNLVATSQHKVIAANWWSGNKLSMIDIHSSDVTWSAVDNTHNPCGGTVESLFNAGDECFGTFYNDRKQQRMGIHRGDKQWECVTDIPSRDQLHCYGIAATREHVYIVGGWNDNGSVHNRILVYDINTGTQCDSKKLSSKRRDCSCTIIDNMLYVGGGVDEVRCLNSIECISLNDYSSHHTIPATPTYCCSLTSLGDRLVMLGGRIGHHWLFGRNSNIVSVLSPSLNSWLPLPTMNEERRLHGTCTVGDDTLVVMGGQHKAFNDVSSCEILRFE